MLECVECLARACSVLGVYRVLVFLFFRESVSVRVSEGVRLECVWRERDRVECAERQRERGGGGRERVSMCVCVCVCV
jgi:hypothetical protein